MGGPSSEHKVSLQTGGKIAEHLDREKFEVLPVKIKKNGKWPITLADLKEKADVAFIAMHGEYGEDGQVQSLLETFSIPYTGSGPMASAWAMDKGKAQLVFAENGLSVPEGIIFKKTDSDIDWEKVKQWELPLVVKPADRGSSVGVSIVKKFENLGSAIRQAFQRSDIVMIQKYIKGRELACGVLEVNGVSLALMPTEIVPKKSDFFDFASKYEAGGSEEITPPDLPREKLKEIQLTALRAHKALGCAGMSRTDLILDSSGKLHVLEINTIPGMTQTSLLPQQAEKMGFEFPRLLEIIIQSALKSRSNR